VLQETKTLGVKEEPLSSLQPISKAFASAGSVTNTSTVTEEEVRRVLFATAPVALQDFTSRFKPRVRTPEVKHTGFVMRFALKYCVLNNCMVFCFSYYFTPWIHLITDLYLFQCMHPAICALCMHMILTSCFVIHVLQDKQHFLKIVKKFAKLDKTKGISYICLREAFASAGSDTNTSTITEEEIRRLLIAIAPVAPRDFVSRFRPRLRTPEVKHTGFIPWIHLIADLYVFQCIRPAVYCYICPMHAQDFDVLLSMYCRRSNILLKF
jgi:hypothetical protein